MITLKNLFISTANDAWERTSRNNYSQFLPAKLVTTAASTRTREARQEEPQLEENHTIACPVTLASRVRNKLDILLLIPISQSIHGRWKASVTREFPLSSSEIWRGEETEQTLFVRTDLAKSASLWVVKRVAGTRFRTFRKKRSLLHGLEHFGKSVVW